MHTSRDAGDGFGYDIETTGFDSRLIEVKGSRSAAVGFHLSRRELEVAREEAEHHELHFWGEIDLGRDPADEYAALRRGEYPVVIADLAAAIESGRFEMQPRSWFLTEGLNATWANWQRPTDSSRAQTNSIPRSAWDDG